MATFEAGINALVLRNGSRLVVVSHVVVLVPVSNMIFLTLNQILLMRSIHI